MRDTLKSFWIGYVLGVLVGVFSALIHVHAASPGVTQKFVDVTPSTPGFNRGTGAEPRYKIAVVDSGYDPARAAVTPKLCKNGHYDFQTNTSNVNYIGNHGTKVISIIAEKLKNTDYCLIVFQVYEDSSFEARPGNVAKAVNDALGLGVSAINLSLGGARTFPAEREAFANLEKTGIPAFLAAGNKKQNLDMNCKQYPACYKFKNIIIVGAQDFDNPKIHSDISNYGRTVSIWAPGYYRMGSNETDYAFGTSFATPRALAEYILFLEHKRLSAAKKHK